MKLIGGAAAVLVSLLLTGAALQSRVRVGEASERGVFVPNAEWIKPAGKTSTFPGRAMDAAWLSESEIVLKTTSGLSFLEPGAPAPKASLPSNAGSSMSGLLPSPKGDLILFSSSGRTVKVAEKDERGSWKWGADIVLPLPAIGGQPHPVGLAWIEPGKTAAVALSRSNSVAILDVLSRKMVKTYEVDICPYGLAASQDRKSLFVACWSPRPEASSETAPSSGTAVPVTPGGGAKSGSLVKLDLATGAISFRRPIGLQPTEVLSRGGEVLVAESNSDKVASYRASDLKPLRSASLQLPGLPHHGASPNALALSPDGRTLLASCGGFSATAVLDAASLKVRGWIPTGWYAGGAAIRQTRAALVGIKGLGSRSEPDPKKRDVYDWTTTVSLFELSDQKGLEAETRAFLGEKQEEAKKAALLAPRPGQKPVPVPERIGEPSVFQHVVFILKENRTYDQIYGDMPEGDGDPSLCLFPRSITPNHHALAEAFGLLDNYYCNGVLSADGHAWATEGQPTAYFERSFGGWTRSYPFGDDPLAISKSGYLWDDIVSKGLSFRNFGEFDYAEPTKKESFLDIYRDFVEGKNQVRFTNKIGVARLKQFSSLDYPGWNMKIPDVLRADRFIREFREMERKGVMPRFTIIYLPQDHHSGDEPGMPTPRAHLADNDLALGRVMEALTKSSFWPKMAVFCNEDDPGGGLDHVDGHRSICLVMSPYSRPGVNSTFYNQASVFATMRRILGFGPLTLSDARAPVMYDCFQSEPRTGAFTALTPSQRLDEINQTRSQIPGSLDLSGPDRADEELRNRKLWAVMKPGVPYPTHYAGAHGRGLAKKGLRLDDGVKEDEEEEEDED